MKRKTMKDEGMLAYVCGEDNKLRLRDAPLPLQADDNAIIRVLASSICGTDLRTFRFGSAKIAPLRVIGHEVIGEIASPETESWTMSRRRPSIAAAPPRLSTGDDPKGVEQSECRLPGSALSIGPRPGFFTEGKYNISTITTIAEKPGGAE